MIRLLRQLINLLTPAQRRQFFTLQLLVMAMSFAEIIAVASVGPFIAVISNPSLVENHYLFAQIYAVSGFATLDDFMFWTGVGVLCLLIFGGLVSMLTVWRLALFSNKVGTEMGLRLYSHYMHQNWLFHSGGSSAQLTKQIATETGRVTSQVLNPLMQMNAKVVLAVFMLIGLFAFSPMVTITAILIFSLSYLLLYKVVRKRLTENGKRISEVSAQRFKLMAEGFGGIKDLLLLGRQQDFIQRFDSSSKRLAISQATNQSLAQAPRYFMELVAYSAIVLLVLYLHRSYQGNLEQILPVLAVYALAGFKLLPAFQNIYMNVAAIKGGMAAFESVRDDLVSSKQNLQSVLTDSNSATRNKIQVKSCIELKEISFCYPGKQNPALKNFSLAIPANKTVGLVGASGSGKSTAIDLLLGLVQPDHGQLLIDGNSLDTTSLRAWQDSLGFVPQTIFLSDASIMENVAFGLARDVIELDKVTRAVSLAHLDELIASLPQGLETRIGERGVQLSGGQRQRIGIARALYHDADVLIFDEATSALDGITEKQIMDAIHDFGGKKTMVMIAHRLKTVEKCDIIYFISDGTVVDSGSFSELVDRNPEFKRMAEHA